MDCPYPVAAKFFKIVEKTRKRLSVSLNDRLLCIGENEQDGGSFLGEVQRGMSDLRDRIIPGQHLDAEIDAAIRRDETLLNIIKDVLNNLEVVDGESERVLVECKLHVESSIVSLRNKKQF